MLNQSPAFLEPTHLLLKKQRRSRIEVSVEVSYTNVEFWWERQGTARISGWLSVYFRKMHRLSVGFGFSLFLYSRTFPLTRALGDSKFSETRALCCVPLLRRKICVHYNRATSVSKLLKVCRILTPMPVLENLESCTCACVEKP